VVQGTQFLFRSPRGTPHVLWATSNPVLGHPRSSAEPPGPLTAIPPSLPPRFSVCTRSTEIPLVLMNPGEFRVYDPYVLSHLFFCFTLNQPHLTVKCVYRCPFPPGKPPRLPSDRRFLRMFLEPNQTHRILRSGQVQLMELFFWRSRLTTFVALVHRGIFSFCLNKSYPLQSFVDVFLLFFCALENFYL